jgi:hypothetical protein
MFNYITAHIYTITVSYVGNLILYYLIRGVVNIYDIFTTGSVRHAMISMHV